MNKYKVTFHFDKKDITWDEPITEEIKKELEEAFSKGKKIQASNVCVDLSKCIFMCFKEVLEDE